MIDLHTHILPAMDDGSRSVEESLQMLDSMRRQGVEAVAATSHFDMRKESVERFLERRGASWQEFVKAGGESLHLGAEVLYCGVALNRIEGIERLCIDGGRYMLIETLSLTWDEVLVAHLQQLMAEQNIIPIMAHIERYIEHGKNKEIALRLQRCGVLMQVNAASFLKRFRSRKAFRLLREGLVQLVASDCHGIEGRVPNLSAAAERISAKYGSAVWEECTQNAKAVVGIE